MDRYHSSLTDHSLPSVDALRLMFEQSVAGMFQSSLNGRNLVANPAFARMLGYESPEAARLAITDVATKFYADPGRRAEINELIANEGGAVVDCESRVRRADGSIIWISESTRIVMDRDTAQPVYIGSIVDVTERKRRQEDEK